jgi:thiol:disulfide interchange protein DsbD
MKLNWLIVTFLFLLVPGCKPAALTESGEEAQAAKIQWVVSLEDSLEAAKKETKPVMASFYSTSCGWCKRLEATTYTDREVIKQSTRFIPLKINCSANRALPTQYGVRGLPTILFFDTEGKVIHKVVGYRQPDVFILEMKKALEKFGGL